MIRSKKVALLFASGSSCIAFVYAVAIHVWWDGAPCGASLSAIVGSFLFSYLLWHISHKKRKGKYLGGMLVGALCGAMTLFCGSFGFGIDNILIHYGEENSLGKIVYIPLFSLMSFPFVLLAMHGYLVMILSAFWGGVVDFSWEKKKIRQ